jgi:hypothetical protein
MNQPQPQPQPSAPQLDLEARVAAWMALRDELSALLARIEYTKLMIRLAQRPR